jgi:hypothetical protein
MIAQRYLHTDNGQEEKTLVTMAPGTTRPNNSGGFRGRPVLIEGVLDHVIPGPPVQTRNWRSGLLKKVDGSASRRQLLCICVLRQCARSTDGTEELRAGLRRALLGASVDSDQPKVHGVSE